MVGEWKVTLQGHCLQEVFLIKPSELEHLEHLVLAELLRMPVFTVWWDMTQPDGHSSA